MAFQLPVSAVPDTRYRMMKRGTLRAGVPAYVLCAGCRLCFSAQEFLWFGIQNGLLEQKDK